MELENREYQVLIYKNVPGKKAGERKQNQSAINDNFLPQDLNTLVSWEHLIQDEGSLTK